MHRIAFPHSPARRQRGGFMLGIIAGLVVGLALALAVALYISKAPAPFVEHVQNRTPEQEAQEAERLKGWDPNSGLGGKPVPQAPLAGNRPAVTQPAASAPFAVAASGAKPAAPAASTAAGTRDPAALLAGAAPPPAVATVKPAASATVKDAPQRFFVQAGAFTNAEDAEQQRARLALEGLAAKVSDADQGGRHIHRVRIGPFDSREAAVAAQGRLKDLGTEAALVRAD